MIICDYCQIPIDDVNENYLAFKRQDKVTRHLHEPCYHLWLMENPEDPYYFEDDLTQQP